MTGSQPARRSNDALRQHLMISRIWRHCKLNLATSLIGANTSCRCSCISLTHARWNSLSDDTIATATMAVSTTVFAVILIVLGICIYFRRPTRRAQQSTADVEKSLDGSRLEPASYRHLMYATSTPTSISRAPDYHSNNAAQATDVHLSWTQPSIATSATPPDLGKTGQPYEESSHAAGTQVLIRLDEFADLAAAAFPDNHRSDAPIYVNRKQFYRILKRRITRQNFERVVAARRDDAKLYAKA